MTDDHARVPRRLVRRAPARRLVHRPRPRSPPTAKRSSSSARSPSPTTRRAPTMPGGPRPKPPASSASAKETARRAHADRRRGRAPHRPQGRVGRASAATTPGLHEPLGAGDDPAAHAGTRGARHARRCRSRPESLRRARLVRAPRARSRGRVDPAAAGRARRGPRRAARADPTPPRTRRTYDQQAVVVRMPARSPSPQRCSTFDDGFITDAASPMWSSPSAWPSSWIAT